METAIEQTRQQFQDDLQKIQNTTDLETIKVKYLGRKGPIQNFMKELKEVPPEKRPEAGKWINDLKVFIAEQCGMIESKLVAVEEEAQLADEKIDITLPGRAPYIGRKHPLVQVMDEVVQILTGMGFSVQDGPEIDTDYYNFEVLNFPPDHPARDMHDTFYISPHVLMRTHTSNVQARVMQSNKPPIRIIAPGKVYRNETITARSHVFFHQVEAVYIDKDVTFAQLMGTMREFLHKLFQEKLEIRFRPSYFPFVEPGMEVDVSCLICQGKGCPVCKHSGWLEIAGAGMVHPQVLIHGGIDPEIYSGFAWGMGIERLLMIQKKIQDIRMFTENDLRFLSQFTAL